MEYPSMCRGMRGALARCCAWGLQGTSLTLQGHATSPFLASFVLMNTVADQWIRLGVCVPLNLNV